jgi:hypothetical protein
MFLTMIATMIALTTAIPMIRKKLSLASGQALHSSSPALLYPGRQPWQRLPWYPVNHSPFGLLAGDIIPRHASSNGHT